MAGINEAVGVFFSTMKGFPIWCKYAGDDAYRKENMKTWVSDLYEVVLSGTEDMAILRDMDKLWQEHLYGKQEVIDFELEGLDDDATNPTYYTDMKITPREFIVANDLDWDTGNVIKYVCRWKGKNGLEDLEKARRYIDFLIEQAKG